MATETDKIVVEYQANVNGLTAQLKTVQTEMAKTEQVGVKSAKAVGASYTDLGKQIESLKKQEKSLEEQRKKTNVASVQQQFTKELAATRAELEKANKEYTNLGKAQENSINSTKSLKQQLKELQAQLGNTKQGTEEFNRLAAAAGKVKDKIADASAATQAFAKDSKSATAKTLFGQVLSDLRELDFAGAADKAKQFAAVMRGITLAETISGIKSLGSALLDVGKALLTNPFVLILGSIVAVGVAIKGVFDAFQAGDAILKTTYENLSKVDEATNALVNTNEDLRIKIRLLNKEINEGDAANLTRKNAYKEAYKKILNEQLAAEKELNDSIEKQRSSAGNTFSKRLGLDTGLLKAQKDGLLAIEQKYGAQKKELEDNLILQAIADKKEANNKELEDEKNKANELIKIQKDLLKKLQELKDAASAKLLAESRAKNSELEIARATEEERLLIAKSGEAERLKQIFEESNKTEQDAEQLKSALLSIEQKYQDDLLAIKIKGYAASSKVQQEINDKEIEAIADKWQKEIDAKKGKKEKSNDIDQEEYQTGVAYFNAAANTIKAGLGAVEEINNRKTDAALENAKTQADAEIFQLDRQLKNREISQEEYDQRKILNDKKLAAQEAEIKRKAFENNKQISLIQTIISTAQATVAALGSIPYTPANIALAAATAAAGAIQIALIQSQPTPKFEKGGRVQGERHYAGGTLIEAEKDEWIINRVQSMKHDKLLESINNGKVESFINEVYLAPVLKTTAKKIKEQNGQDFAQNIAHSLMLNSGFKDSNLLESLKMSRKNDKEIARFIVENLKSQSSYNARKN